MIAVSWVSVFDSIKPSWTCGPNRPLDDPGLLFALGRPDRDPGAAPVSRLMHFNVLASLGSSTAWRCLIRRGCCRGRGGTCVT
jgi:hypothetical protein